MVHPTNEYKRHISGADKGHGITASWPPTTHDAENVGWQRSQTIVILLALCHNSVVPSLDSDTKPPIQQAASGSALLLVNL